VLCCRIPKIAGAFFSNRWAVLETPSASPTTAPAQAAKEPPVRKPAVPAAPVWKAVRGDLASGSKTHRLGAAAHTLIIDYWTTEDPSSWTPDSSPIINLNARIDGAPTGEAIKVTRSTPAPTRSLRC
jgi:hypothetical protein